MSEGCRFIPFSWHAAPLGWWFKGKKLAHIWRGKSGEWYGTLLTAKGDFVEIKGSWGTQEAAMAHYAQMLTPEEGAA